VKQSFETRDEVLEDERFKKCEKSFSEESYFHRNFEVFKLEPVSESLSVIEEDFLNCSFDDAASFLVIFICKDELVG
jgi:hypothetical protein